MKNLFSLVFAGIIGGMITLMGVYFLTTSPIKNASDIEKYAQPVSNNLNLKPGSVATVFDFADAAEKATPSVVHITATSGRNQQNNSGNPLDFLFGNPGEGGPRGGTGSGVIYSSDGYIITNNHVIEDADNIEVTLSNNRTYKAKVIGTEAQADLAVLKIDARQLPVLKKADSDRARIGEWVLAVGNPFDLNSTVTAGIISAKGRDIGIIRGNSIESFIQTDAAVNPGNSGGALIDAQGRLLGINTAIATQTGSYSGYSFAIPVNFMEKIAQDIIEFGSYQRGLLGVYIRNLNNELADKLGLNITQGVVVTNTVESGAAEYAGIKKDDVIIKVNGITVNSSPKLQELVGTKRQGEKVNITINRGGKIKQIPVTLKKG
ncbi:trypsin-like peptidase domain-containing protein [Saprospiraceae bacterium]|nr:trypsin-like peptidase domain-containing protein [Saprospiraceae bacterium]